jgi:hypothetical protein
MSSPDPFLSRVRVFFAPAPRDPKVSSPDPTQKGPGLVSEVRSPCAGSGALLVVGSDPLCVS